MIVGHYFEGDDDRDVAWLQHDVYGEALYVIASTCNQYARFARGVLNDTQHREWGTVDTFDHRTLQGAHDLLAATWRFYNDFSQPELPFKPESALDRVKEQWLRWVKDEVKDWITQPRLIRLVQVILTNQNSPPGYRAEAELTLEILGRFYNVPWDSRLRNAYQEDLAKDLQRE